MAEDIRARSALFAHLVKGAETETGLPVHESLRDRDCDDAYLYAYFPAALFDQIASRAVTRPRAPLRREDFVKEPGRVYLRGRLMIDRCAGEQAESAIGFLVSAQLSYRDSEHARAMVAAYELASVRTAELKRHIERIESAAEVPGECRQCRPKSGMLVSRRRGI